jgi:UDP-GlcNAc:undecaprenyl-phosphate GlcNAc-1-phosphate transferase
VNKLVVNGVAIPLVTAFLCSILLMFVLRPVARHLGLVDRPGGRKMHDGEIPLIGGLAIAGSLFVVSLYGFSQVSDIGYFILAVVSLVVVGVIDDRFDLGPGVRLAAQLGVAALMIFGAEILVTDLGSMFSERRLELGMLAVPFTVLIVIAAVNAFNLFDGSDGIAGGYAAVALAFLGTAAYATGTHVYLPLIAALGGAILGFLIFNWPSKRNRKVRVFMGDAGSTLIGFALAWLSVGMSQGPARPISPAVVLWIFALPLYDMFSCMARRMSEGRSPMSADAGHFHHVLRRWDLRPRRIAQIVLATAGALAACGLIGRWMGVGNGTLVIAWLLVGVVYHMIFGTTLVDRWRRSRSTQSLTAMMNLPAANETIDPEPEPLRFIGTRKNSG